QVGTERASYAARHANGAHLRQRVLHEISGTQVENVGAIDLVELLFQVMETENRPRAAGLVGSDAAERNHVLDSGVSNGSRDRVAGALLKGAEIVAAGVGGRSEE